MVVVSSARTVVVVVAAGVMVVVVGASGGTVVVVCVLGGNVVVVVSSGATVVVVGSVAGTVVVVGLGSAASAGTAASVRDAVDRTAASTRRLLWLDVRPHSAWITVTLVKMLFLAWPIARVRPIAPTAGTRTIYRLRRLLCRRSRRIAFRGVLRRAPARTNATICSRRTLVGTRIDDSGYRSVRAPSRPERPSP